MPTIERRAMDLCQGRVLDIGCGAGTHALHLQEARGLPVTALDNSAACLRAAQLTGVKDVALADFFGFEGEPYDTLLMLMNGAGICGTLANIDRLMAKFQRLLAPGGQILLVRDRSVASQPEGGGLGQGCIGTGGRYPLCDIPSGCWGR